jgi:hypothetical protein
MYFIILQISMFLFMVSDLIWKVKKNTSNHEFFLDYEVQWNSHLVFLDLSFPPI